MLVLPTPSFLHVSPRESPRVRQRWRNRCCGGEVICIQSQVETIVLSGGDITKAHEYTSYPRRGDGQTDHEEAPVFCSILDQGVP